MHRFKFGWHGDNGLGEQMIQLILTGKKTASICPAYDTDDIEVQAGEELLLTDKRGNARAILRVLGMETRLLSEFDEAIAARDGMTLAELLQKLRVANSRELQFDEEMRITFFELVTADPLRLARAAAVKT